MIDDAARNGQSNATEPHSAGDDVVAVNGGNLPNSADLTSGVLTKIVAFAVSLVRNRSQIVVETPLDDGSTFRIYERCSADTLDAFEHLVSLPLKDLANPGIALVTRPSLERLVKAARMYAGTEFNEFGTTNLSEALEPFAEVGQ